MLTLIFNPLYVEKQRGIGYSKRQVHPFNGLNLMLLYHSPEKLRHICARVFAPLYTIISIYAKAYLYIIYRIQFSPIAVKNAENVNAQAFQGNNGSVFQCSRIPSRLHSRIHSRIHKKEMRKTEHCSAFLIFILLMQSATAL
jgi:hypothetical protein